MIKKIFLWIVILAAAAAALVYFFGATWMTQAVETIGPKVTQTTVRLDNVDLSPLSASGTLQGLYIGNPEGYKNEHIFSLNQIDVEMEAKSLLSDKIIVNKIHIRSPEMNYEKTLRGSNIKSLLDNVESFGRSDARETVTQNTAPAEPAKTDSESKPSKKLLIRELLIEDLKVSVGLMGAGTSVTIPRIEMQDLDSSSTKELVAKVLNVILNEVSRQIGAGVSGLGQNTLSELEAIGKQALSQKKDEILKQADQEIEKVQKELEETLEPELIKGIKNLFGK